MTTPKDYSSIRPIDYADSVRYTKIMKPFGNATASLTTSRDLEFHLMRTDFMDGHNVKLAFKAEADDDAASDDVFMSNIKCIWSTLSVKVGNQYAHNIFNYGHLSCILDNIYMSAQERTGRAAIAQGIPALSASGTAVKYSHDILRDGVLDNVLPLYKLPQVIIKFELDSNVAAYTNATTAVGSVDVTDVKLIIPQFRSAKLRAKMDSGDYQIVYTDWDEFSNTALLSGASSHSLVIPASHKSVTGIIIHPRNIADINDPDWGGEKYQACSVFNALSKLYLTIDGQPVPAEPIDCTNGVELYDYLLEFAGGQHGSFFTGAYDTATDGQFILALPLSSEPFDRNVVSGLDLNSKTGQIIVEFSSMTASVNTHIRGWVRYQRIMQISKDGKAFFAK